jgi:phage antirepressor YoqD-like protein
MPLGALWRVLPRSANLRKKESATKGISIWEIEMQLATIGQQPTMSSREIAELLEKQHSNIKISAERLTEKGVIGTLALQEFTHNGNTYTEYLLNKRDSLILVAQNSPEFTARIVDRWQELEAQQMAAVPQTFAAALRLAAEQAEKIEQQQLLIAQQQPAVAFVGRYVEAESNKGIREVAKVLGVKERMFVAYCIDNDILFREHGNLQPFAKWIDAGHFVVKTGEKSGFAFVQTRFTPKGIAWIAKKVQQ